MEGISMLNKASSSSSPNKAIEKDYSHLIHKVPPGDGPYGRAKYAQVVEKDPEGAIVWFWKAINAGDRVDSALKDMAVVMKQLESLDNVLIDLYKKCGKVDEQIMLLKRKLRLIYKGEAFNGKPTKTARSHGKKFQVSVRQETARILGNLGWAYMQKGNYINAEVVYRKAQMIDADANKATNLAHCFIKQARYDEARLVVEDVLQGKLPGSDDAKSRKRAEELMLEIEEMQHLQFFPNLPGLSIEDDFVDGLDRLINEWAPVRSRRLPIFEEISAYTDQLAC
ncbi:hypothetical protein Leryth_000836 [Lithospermum erythrorhizon]|nr:hypothetical protein Leryth_000836 [Lithospermum erythrorhizon]